MAESESPKRTPIPKYPEGSKPPLPPFDPSTMIMTNMAELARNVSELAAQVNRVVVNNDSNVLQLKMIDQNINSMMNKQNEIYDRTVEHGKELKEQSRRLDGFDKWKEGVDLRFDRTADHEARLSAHEERMKTMDRNSGLVDRHEQQLKNVEVSLIKDGDARVRVLEDNKIEGGERRLARLESTIILDGPTRMNNVEKKQRYANGGTLSFLFIVCAVIFAFIAKHFGYDLPKLF